MKQRTGFLCAAVMLAACGLQGCAAKDLPAPERASFASGYHNRSSDRFFCYRAPVGEFGRTTMLDYESMNEVPLCSKPNCNHRSNDCIVKRLNGNVPMFGENCIYYFVDDTPYLKYNDDGNPGRVYHSELCRYDLRTNTEEQLQAVESEVGNNCYGWMLYDNTVYFVAHRYSEHVDENGFGYSGTNTGGEMKLCSIRLSDMQLNEHCDLYDVDALAEYYPLAPNSGEVYMKGLYDNKIYFNVGFVVESNEGAHYRFYVTYYDLTDGTYHGTPADYGNIDFAGTAYCAENALVICRLGEARIYRKGMEQPVELSDAFFNEYTDVTVLDDLLFCDGEVFDLNTKEVREPEIPNDAFGFPKTVVAKYGDSYIISDSGMQENFEKIPAEQLLQP